MSFSLALTISSPPAPSLEVAEWGSSWAVIGPSRPCPLLTSDPTSEEEVWTERQVPFKADELSDVKAAEP